MELIHPISILLELAIAVLGVLIAVVKKKTYGWFITLTFTIYVIYDLAKFLEINTPPTLLNTIFFIATLSMLAMAWRLYTQK